MLDLGCGSGAWVVRLQKASYDVTACDLEPKQLIIPCHQVDLNRQFSSAFNNKRFDAVCLIEVIEHLENPRHVLREARALLKPKGILLLTTPNASGVYSRLRFFFTGKMAQFTDSAYYGTGHITPMTAWQIEKVFQETGFEIQEQRFHDAQFFPPKSAGDIAKIVALALFRILMYGTVGGQNILVIARSV